MLKKIVFPVPFPPSYLLPSFSLLLPLISLTPPISPLPLLFLKAFVYVLWIVTAIRIDSVYYDFMNIFALWSFIHVSQIWTLSLAYEMHEEVNWKILSMHMQVELDCWWFFSNSMLLLKTWLFLHKHSHLHYVPILIPIFYLSLYKFWHKPL